jgi:hypothetical protein
MAVFQRDSVGRARGSLPGARAGRNPSNGLEIIMKEYGDLAKSGNFWAMVLVPIWRCPNASQSVLL